MLRRLAQLAAIGLVVSYAFPREPTGIRTIAMLVTAVGAIGLALGLVLRPVIKGLRPQRRDEQRDWPFS